MENLVSKIQKALAEVGYFTEEVNGHWTNHTQSAYTAYAMQCNTQPALALQQPQNIEQVPPSLREVMDGPLAQVAETPARAQAQIEAAAAQTRADQAARVAAEADAKAAEADRAAAELEATAKAEAAKAVAPAPAPAAPAAAAPAAAAPAATVVAPEVKTGK